jgi:amphi-Trp domain-containing protein
MATLPGEGTEDRTVITDGYFEREVNLSRAATATFLRELANQVEAGSDLTISSDDWEIPFGYREPIEVEVEFASNRTKELEIEVEFTEGESGGGLTVE